METGNGTRSGDTGIKRRKLAGLRGAFTCYDLPGLRGRGPRGRVLSRASDDPRKPVLLFRGGGWTARAPSSRAGALKGRSLCSSTMLGIERLIERAADCGVEAGWPTRSKPPSPRTWPLPSLGGPRPFAVSESRLTWAGWRATRMRRGETLSGVGMTELGEAEEFVKRERRGPGPAVAVGNVHGHYSGTLETDRAGLRRSGAGSLPSPYMAPRGHPRPTSNGQSR